jgi:hypothetical protein
MPARLSVGFGVRNSPYILDFGSSAADCGLRIADFVILQTIRPTPLQENPFIND